MRMQLNRAIAGSLRLNKGWSATGVRAFVAACSFNYSSFCSFFISLLLTMVSLREVAVVKTKFIFLLYIIFLQIATSTDIHWSSVHSCSGLDLRNEFNLKDNLEPDSVPDLLLKLI